jgi:L-seryl-tRNA(Ser) seleniumtransferase
MDRTRLRYIPKVDRVLDDAAVAEALQRVPREIVVRLVQQEVEALRQRLAGNGSAPESREAALHEVACRVRTRLERLTRPSLRRVINATGVVLHTNIGRAPLGAAVARAVAEAAQGYVNLEYDLDAGRRCSRMVHVETLLRELTGADAAIAVNNNAAAVLLCIDTLGAAGVVVSRGEQVEIGDSFRLPDILARSGVPIHEVGTTNRTRPEDYEAAARPGCVLLKVHRSNFSLHGYTQETQVAELAEVARRCNATVVYDLGSGALEAFEAHGLPGEPHVQAALKEGAHVVTMSGDKLLGGPQAGIIAGAADSVAAMRRNPLSRALRIDKLTLAGLEATLLSYVSNGAQDVPARRLILAQPHEIRARAERLLKQMQLQGQVAADLELTEGEASVGGGSFADASLPSFEVSVRPRDIRATEFLARLRRGTPAVVARIRDEIVALDARCVADDEVETLARAVGAALSAGGGEA